MAPDKNADTGPKLGQLILDGDFRRDAIHIAVAPVTAAERLAPGQPARLLLEDDAELVCAAPDFETAVGIVDPFLRLPVAEGQRFWLFLLPGTITSLRHVWSHPVFVKAAAARREKL